MLMIAAKAFTDADKQAAMDLFVRVPCIVQPSTSTIT
jgi:hypothetical protein